MEKIIKRRKAELSGAWSNELHPILQRVYAHRGVTQSSELEKGLDHLLPYHTLLGIESAVQLLLEVIKAQQGILVIGDFDADGATSSALAVSALRAFGANNVQYLVPNRFEYGYGLTPEIVAVAAKQNPQLIITVDNGISSCAGVLAAKSYGMRVLITDHHLAGPSLPEADAIVNPNQPGDLFPSKHLAGVGVIFYVLLALRGKLRSQNWFATQAIPEPNMAEYLDLVALGTVADVVPLDKNNRILVYQGLARIRSGKCRPGIRALLEVAKRKTTQIAAADLGFAVGPRLNAAGRLDDMSLGIECLLASDLTHASELAKILDEFNQERRFIEADMQKQAVQTIAKLQLNKKVDSLPWGVCLYDESWHQGVIGILASRIKDQLNRPVIAFAPANDRERKGSARSIAGLHIRDVLESIARRYPAILSKFGGHAMAAGLTLNHQNYATFCQVFDETIRSQVDPQLFQRAISSDGELTLADFSLPLAQAIEAGGPWGQGFPAPIFDGYFRVIEQRLVGDKHLKLRLGMEDRTLDAIYFNVDVNLWPNHRCEHIHAAYRLEINEYRDEQKVQLIIEHIEAE